MNYYYLGLYFLYALLQTILLERYNPTERSYALTLFCWASIASFYLIVANFNGVFNTFISWLADFGKKKS